MAFEKSRPKSQYRVNAPKKNRANERAQSRHENKERDVKLEERKPATRDEIEVAASDALHHLRRAYTQCHSDQLKDPRDTLLLDKKAVESFKVLYDMIDRTIETPAPSTLRRAVKDINALSRAAEPLVGNRTSVTIMDPTGEMVELPTLQVVEALKVRSLTTTPSAYYSYRSSFHHAAKEALDALNSLIEQPTSGFKAPAPKRKHDRVTIARAVAAANLFEQFPPDKGTTVAQRQERGSEFKRSQEEARDILANITERRIEQADQRLDRLAEKHPDRAEEYQKRKVEVAQEIREGVAQQYRLDEEHSKVRARKESSISKKLKKKGTARTVAKYPEVFGDIIDACVQDIEDRVQRKKTGAKRRGREPGLWDALATTRELECKVMAPVIALTGARPVEVFRGLEIDLRHGEWIFKIQGGKVTKDAGQEWRVIGMAHDPKLRPAAALLDVLDEWGLIEPDSPDDALQMRYPRDEDGNPLPLVIDVTDKLAKMGVPEEEARKQFSKWMGRICDRTIEAYNGEGAAMLKRAAKNVKITPYSFRHAFSAHVKGHWEEFFDDLDDVSVALGHRTEKMKTMYGSRNQGGSGGAKITRVQGSNAVKRNNAQNRRENTSALSARKRANSSKRAI